MCCNSNLDIIVEICSVIVAIISLVVAAIHFYRQNRMEFYAKYTQRNMEIMKNMPDCVLYKEKAKVKGKDLEVFRVQVFLYFDLCSEEYYLHLTKNIEEKVWNEWKEGMKDFFNRSLVNEQLQDITIAYKESYHDFIDFLKYELQIENI